MSSNNPPYKVVEFDKELYDFVIENCDKNIEVALRSLNLVQSRDLAEKVVALLENFKKLKKAMEQGT